MDFHQIFRICLPQEDLELIRLWGGVRLPLLPWQHVSFISFAQNVMDRKACLRVIVSLFWKQIGRHITSCNILTYVSSINTWASGDSPLAQLVKELDLCLYLCVIRRL